MGATYVPYNPYASSGYWISQGLKDLFSGLGQGMARQQANRVMGQDLQRLQAWSQSQLGEGQVGPQMPFPSFRSPQMQQMAAQSMMPMTPYQEAMSKAALIKAREISPSQQISAVKLKKINELQAKIDEGRATEDEKSMLEKMIVGQPLVNIGMGAAPATALKEINDYQMLSDTLTDINSLLDQTKKYQGPGRAALTTIQKKYGKTPFVGGMIGGTPPKGIVELQNMATNATDILARLRTGAAINLREEQLYSSLLPKIDLPYETNLRNLKIFQKWVNKKVGQLNRSYKGMGFKVPEPKVPMINVVGPSGEEGMISIEEWDEARKHGWKMK